MRKTKISNNTRSSNSRKRIFIILILVALSAAGVYFFAVKRNAAPNNSESTPEQVDQETITYAPANDDEKQQAEDNKQRIVEQQEQEQQNSSNNGTIRTVNVVVTSASMDSIFARVSGVVEDGGTCTATFTKGGTALSKSSDSIANVSDTQCGRIVPPSLASGTWQVVVAYKSNFAQGSSEPVALTIP
jgi:hypothetical protein